MTTTRTNTTNDFASTRTPRIVPGQSIAKTPSAKIAKSKKSAASPAVDAHAVDALIAETYQPRRSRAGVCVVDGYGIRIRVERGRVVITDGLGEHRREQRYGRVAHGLRRILIIGHTGTITLDAIRWLADARVPWTQIDHDGTVLAAATGDHTLDGRIRRAQACALDTPLGLDIARRLLVDKLSGQRNLMPRLRATARATAQLDDAIDVAHTCDTLPELLFAEAQGAVGYWAAFSVLPIRFAAKDLAKIPDHWHTVGQRKSVVGGGTGRLATSPAHALLNYLYAILETETLIACHTVGLDPTLGFFHVDNRRRASLLYDLMEPARPAVDAYVLDLLDTHTFRAVDFTETRHGVCRILAPLTHTLADTTTTWAAAIAPIAEHVAHTLEGQRTRTSGRAPTPLTKTNRRARTTKTTAAPRAVKLPKPCTNCAAPLPNNQRDLCEQCLATSRADTLDKMRTAGPKALDAWRATADPTAQQRAHAAAMATRAKKHAQRSNGTITIEDYTRHIQPALTSLTVDQIVAATGFTTLHATRVRRGTRTPDPRHWAALDALATAVKQRA